MTSGNWSVGPFPAYGSHKEWAGDDGKYEAWIGGIRFRWNNYSVYRYKYAQKNGSAWVQNLPQHTLTGVKTIVGWSDNDEIRLLDKLAQRVRGHSFDLGINIAEASKTYGTILQNLRTIGSALLSLKHGNVPEALRTLGSRQRSSKRVTAKDISGRWLETQYAFLPLVSQSYEAGKALEALTSYRELKFSVSSGAKRVVAEVSSAPTLYNHKVSWVYRQSLIAELIEDISTTRSLGLTNPAQVVWELVPYSFVVDWFLPIGTYLSAWGVIPALKGRFLTIERGSGRTVSCADTPYYANLVEVNNWGSEWSYGARAFRGELFHFKRTKSNSLSVPLPRFNSVPRALSPKRILNAVSLIHQRLR